MDFFVDLPSEIISEEPESKFFKPQPGLYKAIWADTVPVYKDALTGKLSEEPTEHCEVSFVRQKFVIISYVGVNAPEPVIYLNKNSEGDYVLTNSKNASSIIFGDFIALDKKEQWKIHRRYSEDFNPPLWGKREDGKTVTILSNFPKHYGDIVFLYFDLAKNGKLYLNNIKPSSEPKYPESKLKSLIDEIIELTSTQKVQPGQSGAENDEREELPF